MAGSIWLSIAAIRDPPWLGAIKFRMDKRGWVMLGCAGLLALSACGDTEPGKAAAGGGGGDATKPSGGAGAGGSSTANGGASNATDIIKAYCGALRSCCQVDGFPTEPLANCETDAKQQINLFAGLERGTVVATSQRSKELRPAAAQT